jgi:hypothetical protein
VLGVTFVRDCLLANGVETLRDVYCRPMWQVPQADLHVWYASSRTGGPTSRESKMSLLSPGDAGQQCISGVLCGIRQKHVRVTPVPSPWSLRPPWQRDYPLPAQVSIDLSNRLLWKLPFPDGWDMVHRNGRNLIKGLDDCSFSVDAAQYGSAR